MNKKTRFFLILTGATILFVVLHTTALMDSQKRNQVILFNIEAQRMISDKDPSEIEQSKEFISRRLSKLGYENVEISSEIAGYSHDVKIEAKTPSGQDVLFVRK